MKVGIIGGGLFGISAALELDRVGHQVTIFEKNSAILQGASGINQYRLHRGYHYPRSAETMLSCIAAEPSFRDMYGEALMESFPQYYAIAREGSKTSAAQFQAMCRKHGLFLKEEDLSFLYMPAVEAVFRAKESLIDPVRLRSVCERKLRDSKVLLKVNSDTNVKRLREEFDHVVVAAYAWNNDVLSEGDEKMKYQFEVCEKPVAKLPAVFRHKSVVVLDGPFMCFDPFGDSEYHVLGNVVQAIHSTNVGESPYVPTSLHSLINRGIIKNPTFTKFPQFLSSAKKFFPGIEEAEHIGSMYTVRAVLPHHEETDARPTLVRRVGEKTTLVFSGKLVQAPLAAKEVVTLAESSKERVLLSPDFHPSSELSL